MFPGADPSVANLSNEEVRKIYRITDDYLVNTRRILFVNGGFDSTTAIGSLQNVPISADPNSTRAILEYSFGHAQELFSSTVTTNAFGQYTVPYPV
jgi:hypothetical protein